jgi:thiol-disulfide isomerase/thioredoxin
MASYRDLGLATELENTIWLNTDQPLRPKNLHGKVVLLEMWTFDCINCQHFIPSLRDWYQEYKDSGLVIIGNHFTDFPFEKDLTTSKPQSNKTRLHIRSHRIMTARPGQLITIATGPLCI